MKRIKRLTHRVRLQLGLHFNQTTEFILDTLPWSSPGMPSSDASYYIARCVISLHHIVVSYFNVQNPIRFQLAHFLVSSILTTLLTLSTPSVLSTMFTLLLLYVLSQHTISINLSYFTLSLRWQTQHWTSNYISIILPITNNYTHSLSSAAPIPSFLVGKLACRCSRALRS